MRRLSNNSNLRSPATGIKLATAAAERKYLEVSTKKFKENTTFRTIIIHFIVLEQQFQMIFLLKKKKKSKLKNQN